jgi:hypothetical protein
METLSTYLLELLLDYVLKTLLKDEAELSSHFFRICVFVIKEEKINVCIFSLHLLTRIYPIFL